MPFRAALQLTIIPITSSMRHLYALLVLVLTMGFCLSDSRAQTYTFADYLVRTIPNDFQDISGIGTDVSSHTSQWDWYYRVHPNEITIPFNFRWLNTVSNKIKITSQGAVVLGGAAEIPDGVTYLYGEYYYYYWYYKPYSYGGNYMYGLNNRLTAWLGAHDATAESKVHMAVLGTAPNRKVVVQASKVVPWYYSGSQPKASYQVVLFESGISRWEAHYREDAPGTWNPYYYYYGPFTGATGWDTPSWSGYAGVRNYGVNTSTGMIYLTSFPNTVGAAPSVGYGPYPQTYNRTIPTVGYRFFIAYPYDLAASAITYPMREQILNKDVAFTPTGVITNEGSAVPSSITVNRRITLFGVGQAYNQSITTSSPASFSSANLSFPDFTPLSYGIYYDTMEVISTTPADQYAANNIVTTTYVVSPPNNMKAISVNNPAPGSRTPINIPTPVGATFRNLGANNQINVPVSMVIYSPTGQVVYRDTVRFPSTLR